MIDEDDDMVTTNKKAFGIENKKNTVWPTSKHQVFHIMKKLNQC